MRILVTGSSGFIGSHLVPTLVEDGHDIYAVVRDIQQLSPAGDGVTVVECDLSRQLNVSTLPEVDAIVHLAQANVSFPEHANELYRVNTVSTQQLLDYGRQLGCSHFVYASSGAVYGFGARPFSEFDELVPHSFYAVTKINSEQIVSIYRSFFATAILRFFFPYGSGQHGRLIPGLTSRVQEGQPVILNDGGRPRVNPIYIDDVIRVIQRVLAVDDHCVLNVAGDETYSIRELSTLIGEVTGRQPRFEQGTSSSPGDVIGDNCRMREMLDIGTLVSLREGLPHTMREP